MVQQVLKVRDFLIDEVTICHLSNIPVCLISYQHSAIEQSAGVKSNGLAKRHSIAHTSVKLPSI